MRCPNYEADPARPLNAVVDCFAPLLVLVLLECVRLWRVMRRRCAVVGIGWEYTHVAIGGHSRLAYSEVLADETARTTAVFLRRAIAWYAAQGIVVECLLTDNGPAYRSTHCATVALTLSLSQRFTQPYRPQTSGKAARLIRTLLTAWAYATATLWVTHCCPSDLPAVLQL
jgi:transposase InsO family protein